MYYIGALLGLIGAIWLTVNAIRKDGALAGILCFICFIYTIYYGIKNFGENKVPFILYLVGLGLCVVFRPSAATLQALGV